MQLPEGIPTRTVTGLYLTLDGSPATGDVHFYAPGPLLDSENNVILANRTFVACLDYDGRVTVELPTTDNPRSEEHTSELQSRENLVCRLLLEKKKNTEHKCL